MDLRLRAGIETRDTRPRAIRDGCMRKEQGKRTLSFATEERLLLMVGIVLLRMSYIEPQSDVLRVSMPDCLQMKMGTIIKWTLLELVMASRVTIIYLVLYICVLELIKRCQTMLRPIED
jgi:hypothetical protein